LPCVAAESMSTSYAICSRVSSRAAKGRGQQHALEDALAVGEVLLQIERDAQVTKEVLDARMLVAEEHRAEKLERFVR
jgi:hypothetical protein